MFKSEDSSAVLPQKFGGGPRGLGDPEDKTLRRVEKEVLVPKVMREKAKVEKCFEEVAAFESCCKDNSLLMVVTCRKQNDHLKTCLSKWYTDEAFKAECTEIYLSQRSKFRSDGTPKEASRLHSKAEGGGSLMV